MKNVLIMLDYYFPNASPNGICCRNVIDELKKKYSVYLMCYNTDSHDYSCMNEEGITKINIPINIDKNKKNIFKKLFYYIKWLIPFKKYPPYANKRIINLLYNEAEKIIEKYSIDIVVSVHLPIETLIVGHKLKGKFENLFFTAYMLDSFSGGFLPKKLPQSYCRKRKINWEKNILSTYNRIFLMNSSKNHHELKTKKFDWYSNAEYLDIPMILNKKTYDKKENNNGIVKLLYTGTLDKNVHNPETIIKVLYALKDENIICEFVGYTDCEDDFNELKKMYGKRLIFTGRIPYEDVKEKIYNSDILINIGVRNPNAIPCKIFDYISYKKPIISTYEIDEEPSIYYLKKYPLTLLVDGRENIDLNRIKNFISSINQKYIDEKFIKKYFFQNEPIFFVKKLMEAYDDYDKKQIRKTL